MLIESKKNVSKPYRLSRDYQILLKLLDIITVPEKSDIDNFTGLLNADKCPSKYLPLLATLVGYEYDYNLSYESNRIIIKYYSQLIRLRGSFAGIEMAVALAIGAQENYNQITNIKDLMSLNYIKEEGRLDIYIYYPNYLEKVVDLIEAVRPVGLGIKIIPAKSLRNSNDDNIEFTVKVFDTYGDVDKTDRYKVSDINDTGFGEIEKLMDPRLRQQYYPDSHENNSEENE